MENICYVSIGSNIDKEDNMKKCKKLLKMHFKKIRFSKVHQTKPVGYQKQENFLNAVCRIETKKTYAEVKAILKGIEKKLKRKKNKIKSGPRTIDLDLLTWNKKTINKSAREQYNLVGLKDVLVKGEAKDKIEKLVLEQKFT